MIRSNIYTLLTMLKAEKFVKMSFTLRPLNKRIITHAVHDPMLTCVQKRKLHARYSACKHVKSDLIKL